MTDEKTETGTMTLAERVKRAGLFVLFSFVLLIPKALGLRRRRALWNTLRIVMVLSGAFLVARGFSSGGGATGMLLGGAAILLALAIPPFRKSRSPDDKARELGALVALNGGIHRSPDGKQACVRLYVAPDRLHVLDERECPVLEIPVPEIASLRVTGDSDSERTLLIEWRTGKAEFLYQGFFAAHLAEVARRTVASRLRAKLHVLQ